MSIRRAINRFFEVHEVAWEIFMIVLAVIFVVIGFLPDWTQLSPATLDTLSQVDWAITIIFVATIVRSVTLVFDATRCWLLISRVGFPPFPC